MDLLSPVSSGQSSTGQSEQWQSIPGYEGLYELSTLGRVRSLNHVRRNQLWRGRIRKLDFKNRVQLSKEGQVKLFSISTLQRMVAG